MLIFYFLVTLIVWQGIISLLGGFRYLAFMQREMKIDGSTSDSSLYAPLSV
jgi:hypothetical protein